MSGAALLVAAALGQLALTSQADLPLGEAPALEVWAHEDFAADTLLAIARLPRTTLALRTRSNMLRPEVFAVLKTRRAAVVQVSGSLGEAHVDQFRKLGRATLVLELAGPPPEPLAHALNRLGPQLLRVRAARMDGALAKALERFKNLEVELDLRGRVPEQEELVAFHALRRARRSVRLRAQDAPELVAGLRALDLTRVVVDSFEDRVPEAMTAALARLAVPVRVAMDGQVTATDVRRLGSLPQLSLEIRLDREDDLKRVQQLAGELSSPGE